MKDLLLSVMHFKPSLPPETCLGKVTSSTTDGTLSMVRKYKGFVHLCKNDEMLPSFSNYH